VAKQAKALGQAPRDRTGKPGGGNQDRGGRSIPAIAHPSLQTTHRPRHLKTGGSWGRGRGRGGRRGSGGAGRSQRAGASEPRVVQTVHPWPAPGCRKHRRKNQRRSRGQGSRPPWPTHRGSRPRGRRVLARDRGGVCQSGHNAGPRTQDSGTIRGLEHRQAMPKWTTSHFERGLAETDRAGLVLNRSASERRA